MVCVVVGAGIVVLVVEVVDDVEGAPGTVGRGAVVGGTVTGGGTGSATVHDAIMSSPFLLTYERKRVRASVENVIPSNPRSPSVETSPERSKIGVG